MSRPANCWNCGVDPSDWWLQDVGGHVWCSSCHSDALALVAALVNTDRLVHVVLLVGASDPHLGREIERTLLDRHKPSAYPYRHSTGEGFPVLWSTE